MDSNVAIEVKGLTKTFKVPTEKSHSIKQTFVNWTKGIKGYREQTVLEDISFTIEKGDFFGIVGRNGSGKSTLLKIISGIYIPNKGTVTIDGSLVSFIELGIGFNDELSGRENVYLNGALMGFSVSEIDTMYDDIVEFAELHEFMDQKLKNYSSGMQVRLAFSCAIRATSDILVLDEVLAVGDEAFQRKCFQYFAKLRKEQKTVILVTHSMDAVQQFCTKAMMIQDGEVTHIGNTAKIAQAYRELNYMDLTNQKESDTRIDKDDIQAVLIQNSHADRITFDLTIHSKRDLEDPVITFLINRDNGERVFRWVTDERSLEELSIRADQPFKVALEIQNIFPNGVFDVQVAVKKRDRTVDYAVFDELAKFEIVNQGSFPGDIYWKPNETYTIGE